MESPLPAIQEVLHEGMDELSAAWAARLETEAAQLRVDDEEKQWTLPSIYRVPHFIKETFDKKGKNFEPQVVSFGPFHHGDSKLKPMERHKERAVAHILRRTEMPLMNLLRAVKADEKRLLESYVGLDERWREGGDEFVRMMTVDGCFMLELMRVHRLLDPRTCSAFTYDYWQVGTVDYGPEGVVDYGQSDPVFGINSLMPYMRRDVLMIGNQLPLFLLRTLLSVFPEGGLRTNHDLNRYINKALLILCNYKFRRFQGDAHLGLHALEIFRRSRLASFTPNFRVLCCYFESKYGMPDWYNKHMGTNTDKYNIRSATRLHESGIRFRSSSNDIRLSCFDELRFDKDSGELFLPPLMVDDTTECELVNMVAFEHLHADIDNSVSSFVQFMAKIIDNDKDVDVLKRQGVLGNALGGDRNLVELFNNLAKEITIDYNDKLRDVEVEVSIYCGKKRNLWSTHLRQYYFRSPWTVLSIVAAAFAILLSLLQTIYTVWGFYHKN